MSRELTTALAVVVAAGLGCTEPPSTAARARSATAAAAPASTASAAAPNPVRASSSTTPVAVSPPPLEPPAPLDFDPTPRVRFEGRGKFAKVVVVDEGPERHLKFGSAEAVSQSTISLASPESVPLEYIRVAFCGVLLAKDRRRALMVGLGGGSFTTLLRRHFPKMHIDVAEIDPLVKRVAIEFFGVREDERYRIHIVDGAEYVAAAEEPYDVSLVDAYEGDDIPPQLQRQEFFHQLRAKTAPGGVAVLNLSVPEQLERTLEGRFRKAFARVMCARTRWGGLVLFGRSEAHGIAPSELLVRADQESAHLGPSFDLVATARKIRPRCER